jgi:peptidoglycan/xylan/chitin deacetylase (PgdA/CDA1 family)
MQAGKVYVTTSWDDGHELDLRLASELAAHGMAGTFYVAPRCREIPSAKRLGPGALRELAEGHEIGAHTLTHPRLTELPAQRARSEILEGKDAVEDSIGRSVTSFCYPYGAYAEDHPDMVRSAGFTVARTVDRFRTGAPTDLLRMGTSVHAYRHLADGPQVLRWARSPRQVIALWRNWDLLGRRLFEDVQSNGGAFHLWGHSWEVDANDDWRRLRSVLDELSDKDAVFVTNGELAIELQGER